MLAGVLAVDERHRMSAETKRLRFSKVASRMTYRCAPALHGFIYCHEGHRGSGSVLPQRGATVGPRNHNCASDVISNGIKRRSDATPTTRSRSGENSKTRIA